MNKVWESRDINGQNKISEWRHQKDIQYNKHKYLQIEERGNVTEKANVSIPTWFSVFIKRLLGTLSNKSTKIKVKIKIEIKLEIN